MRPFRSFHSFLSRHPFTTHVAFTTVITATGDLLVQYATGLEKWDKLRTARSAVLGMVIIAPPLSIWFRVLDRIKHPNVHVQNFRRLTIDHFIFRPWFMAHILFNFRLLEGYTINESVERLKKDWLGVYLASSIAWPPAQVLNFYFVPLNYRLILSQTVAFFFNTWFSYYIQKKKQEENQLNLSIKTVN